MSKNLAIALAVALLAVSCSRDVSRIRTHSLPSSNPTSYSFPLPVEEVHTKALQAFSREHQYREPIFRKPARTDSWESVLSAECSTNALYGKAVFADPANGHDLYLHSSHAPIAISAVYRGRGGGLPFMADFHLHLTSSGSDTIVSIKASQTELLNGEKFGLGMCGPGWHWNCIKVRPTTIEEYTVLAYLGRYLGVTNMPPVILPAESVSSIK